MGADGAAPAGEGPGKNGRVRLRPQTGQQPSGNMLRLGAGNGQRAGHPGDDLETLVGKRLHPRPRERKQAHWPGPVRLKAPLSTGSWSGTGAGERDLESM